MDFISIRVMLDQLRKSEGKSLMSSIEQARAICQCVNYVELRNYVDKESVPALARYSCGLNLGYLGYYTLSDVRVQITNNVRRGRLVRNPKDNSLYTYEYNKAGTLLRIYEPDVFAITYCCAEKDVKCFVTFDSNTTSEVPSIKNTAFAKYDRDGYPEVILDILWLGKNLTIPSVEIDIYESPCGHTQKCRLITAMQDPEDEYTLRRYPLVDWAEMITYGDNREILTVAPLN